MILKQIFKGLRRRPQVSQSQSGAAKWGQLNYYNDSWPLLLDICPCDDQLIEYLEHNNIYNKKIFHFGTGGHHILGNWNNQLDEPNEIFAVTASKEEYGLYMDFVIENPQVANTYKVLFTDIYTLTSRLVHDFDIVTLFHLCEYYNEKQLYYAPLDDASLLELFTSHINPNGMIFFYTGSWGFQKASVIIQQSVNQGKMELVDEYRDLQVYVVLGNEGR